MWLTICVNVLCNKYTGATTTEPPRSRCDIGRPQDRVNCGFIHMRPRQCTARGCCWDTSVLGVPWCFYGKDIIIYTTLFAI